LERERHASKRLKLAAVAFNQALAHHRLRDLEDAKRMYLKALELLCMFESSDQSHLINVAHAYCNLASL
jgi:hypothetical protein